MTFKIKSKKLKEKNSFVVKKFCYQGAGLDDRDTGVMVERISYKKMMKKYKDVPKGEVWEGDRTAWRETFKI